MSCESPLQYRLVPEHYQACGLEIAAQSPLQQSPAVLLSEPERFGHKVQ